MYSYDVTVGYSMIDAELKMTIPSVLNLFQDAAIFEAENSSISTAELTEQKVVWFLSSWQLEVYRRPKLNEKVEVSTMPYDFKGFLGYRNFLLKTKEGEILIKGASVWTLINIETLHPTRPSQELINSYKLSEKLDMDYAPRRINIDTEAEGITKEEIKIGRMQLDGNQHLNNVEYVKMAIEFLPFSGNMLREIKGLRVEYRKAAVVTDKVIPVVYSLEDKMCVKLNNEVDEVFAIVEFIY